MHTGWENVSILLQRCFPEPVNRNRCNSSFLAFLCEFAELEETIGKETLRQDEPTLQTYDFDVFNAFLLFVAGTKGR